MLPVAFFHHRMPAKEVTLKDGRSERHRHHLSLWINIPSCLSPSDLDFPNFATQNFHIGVDSDGLGHFLVRFVRENLSELPQVCGSRYTISPGWD